MIKYITGDALQVNADLLVHQVNCQGIMAAGIGKQIHLERPDAYYKYKALCNKCVDYNLLGKIQVVDNTCNLFGQLRYGRYAVQTDMNAVREAFTRLYYYCTNYEINSVVMPYNIGCGLAGGNWEEYLAVISEFDANVSNVNPKLTTFICKKEV